MHFPALVLAGLLEIVFAVALSRSDGFRDPLWVAVFLATAAASLALLQHAMTEIPIGTAYAVWTGIGAAGTAIAGIVLLGEPAQVARLLCVGLILVAVIGLQLSGGGHA